MLSQVTRERPAQQREQIRENMDEVFQKAANPGSLREEFESLEQVWARPGLTGFEPQGAAAQVD